MAKLELKLKGNFNVILEKIENSIAGCSLSSKLEDKSDFVSKNAKCSVRVFERYSYLGANRVSMSVTLFQNDEDNIFLSAITAGGSTGVFLKINTIGEETFLDKLRELFEIKS